MVKYKCSHAHSYHGILSRATPDPDASGLPSHNISTSLIWVNGSCSFMSRYNRLVCQPFPSYFSDTPVNASTKAWSDAGGAPVRLSSGDSNHLSASLLSA